MCRRNYARAISRFAFQWYFARRAKAGLRSHPHPSPPLKGREKSPRGRENTVSQARPNLMTLTPDS
jgi:hypothetical protein